MFFLNKIFRNNFNKIECPRCLGKGHVTDSDIKRLKRELKWRTGSCAYCNGIGKIKKEVLKKIPVDTTYLSIDLPVKEAKKLMNGDYDALERAKLFDSNLDDFIEEIKYMYFSEEKNVTEIASHFLKSYPEGYNNEYETAGLIVYIKKVIEVSINES